MWSGDTANGSVQDIEFSVDGQTLAIAGSTKVELWNATTGIKTYETASSSFRDRIALADNGSNLMISSEGNLKIVDVKSGTTALSSAIPPFPTANSQLPNQAQL